MPSPLAIMAVIAPSALLGALLFFFVYDEHSTKNDIQRDKHQLETMKFDRDFSNAWNGDSVTPPKENHPWHLKPIPSQCPWMTFHFQKKKKKKENVELKKFRTTLSTQ